MIEYGVPILYTFMTLIGIVIAFGSMTLIFKFENILPMVCVIVFGMSIFSFGIYLMMEYSNEYNEQLEIEIENADCDGLKELYDKSSRMKEKIKTTYLFDCVSDKQDLEMLLP